MGVAGMVEAVMAVGLVAVERVVAVMAEVATVAALVGWMVVLGDIPAAVGALEVKVGTVAAREEQEPEEKVGREAETAVGSGEVELVGELVG